MVQSTRRSNNGVRVRVLGACLIALIAAASRAQSMSTGYWITANEAVQADSAHSGISLQFRRSLQLPSRPASLVVHVSADNRFILYVNGQRIAEGPARGNPAHWRYESVDLAPYLQAGTNVLAARVWNDAKLAPLAQMSTGRTGFWLQAQEVGITDAIDSDENWQVRVDRARSIEPGAAQILRSVGPEFYAAGPPETFDAAKLVVDWADPGNRAPDWRPAQRIDAALASAWTLEPDALPPMRYEAVSSGRVVRAHVKHRGRFPAGRLLVPPNTETAVFVDAGRVLSAYPVLTVSGGAGARISLTYAESLYDPKSDTGNPHGARHLRFVDRATVRNGVALGLTDTHLSDGSDRQRFEPLWWRTWRFVEVRIKTGQRPLTLDSLQTYETGYPFEQRARFVSSDSELNSIWQTGWRTAQLDAHETYTDTAYWEQLQYIGDTRIQMLISYYVSGDARLAVQALDAFDQSRALAGLPQSAAPGVLDQVIPPFALLWIGALHDYWMHESDTRVLTRLLPGERAVLDHFERYVQPTGLVGPMPGWPFVDWRDGLDGWTHRGSGMLSCVITMQYLGALQEASDLERELGESKRADTYQVQEIKVRDGLNAQCWDERRGLYADTPDKTHFSQHANALAVLYDIAPAAQQRALMERIIVPGAGIDAPADVVGTSYYFSFYLARALAHSGLADQYLDLLKPWRDMLHRNFTTWPETPDPSRSDSHAWSAHPTTGLLEYVAGVISDAPGFRRVRIAPHLGTLSSLDAAVAHPEGLIQTQYALRSGKLTAQITLPAGIVGSFEWQGMTRELSPGRNDLSLSADSTADQPHANEEL